MTVLVKKTYRTIIHRLVCCLFTFIGCNTVNEGAPRVEYRGTIHAVMTGQDISGKISLDSLKNKEHLFALGAAENLKGEIIIWESKPYRCYVDSDSLKTDSSYNSKAALLVYSEVKNWERISIPTSIKTYEDLETFIGQTVTTNSLFFEQPFPFLLVGTAKNLKYHVINWSFSENPTFDAIHSNMRKDSLSEVIVKMMGFYSTKHQGVFTHFDSNMHVHFITEDKKISGHIDEIEDLGTMTLFIPK
jgi:acetolactate decarboxylase